MDWWSITFGCQLLEDMHSGSGTGRLGFVDDQHARDVRGQPVVWWSALAGQLRDAADELYALLGCPGERLAQIRKLFGAEGQDARSAAVVSSLHFDRRVQPQGADLDLADFAEITSTAREVNSRRPLDETLRTIEMAAAGLAAVGEIRLRGDPADVHFVQQCLKRLVSLGAGKTRGMGIIRITGLVPRKLQLATRAASPPPSAPCRLRLLLRNLEPICLAATGHPGNIIDTLTFIPGQALRGAVLTGISESGVTAADRYARRDVQFLNAYVVDPSDDQPLEHPANLESLPLPLSVQESKPTERGGAEGIAWWAESAGGFRPWPNGDVDRDQLHVLLAGTPHRGTEQKYKRVKAESYLVTRGDGRWRRGQPETNLLMRNGTPVTRVERNFDSRRPKADGSPEELKQVGDLFSQTVLAEHQLFVADIRFDDADTAAAFARDAAPFLDGDDRIWLRIGRGGRPVRIEKYQWLDDDPVKSISGGSFTLTLTSDLICRHDDLTFRTALDGPALWALAGLDPWDYDASIEVVQAVCEPRLVHGFNAASGTVRSPDLAIRRGSALLVRGGQAQKLKQLFDALAACEAKGHGLGERTEEGFGRFRLDHPCHRGAWGGNGSTDAATSKRASAAAGVGRDADDAAAKRRAMREAVIEAVLEMVRELDLAKHSADKPFPARTQWQWLRHRAEPARTKEDVQAILGDIRDRSQRLSGRMWLFKPQAGSKPLIESLGERCLQFETFAEQRLFLIYLPRWVVARQDDGRRKKFRNEGTS